MSKVINFVVGAALTVVGAVTGNPALLFAGVSMFVGAALNALLAPGTPQRQASEVSLTIGETDRQALFGAAAVAGSLVDAFNYGGANGTDWEVVVIAIADHRCDGLIGFYVNDQYVAYAGDGDVAGYNGQLSVWWRDGQPTQSVPSVLTANGGWSSSDQLSGVAYVVAAYKADASDAKNPIWTAGRPSFLWHVRGKRCYDPRKDSTVTGGSGAHRWTDPATWEWTENAEICRYNFDRGIYACDRVTSPADLLIGRGLSAVEAPPERIFAAANICDEDVPLKAGGSEKRYIVGGTVSSRDEFGSVEEDFAAAMGGIVIQPEGSIGVEPGHAKSPVAWFTDDDLVSGTQVMFSHDRSEVDQEWVNTVAARYNEPAQKWQEHGAPVRRNSADLIADGGPREASMTLRFVHRGTQAQRIAEIRRRLGRLVKTAQCTLGPRFAYLEEGDWVVWTSARRTGGVPVTFQIVSYAIGKEWRNQLALRQIETSVYDWSTSDEIADGTTAESQTPPAAHAQPPASDWSVSGGSIAGGESRLPAIIIDGAVTDHYATGVLFEYKLHDDSQWSSLPIAAPTIKHHVLTGLVPTASYDVGVTYYYDDGHGDRRVLGPVTTDLLSIPNAGSFTLRDIVNTVVGADMITKSAGGDGWSTGGRAASVESYVGVGYASATLTRDQMIGITNDPGAILDPIYLGINYAIHQGGDGHIYAWLNGSIVHDFGVFAEGKKSAVYTDGNTVTWVAPDGSVYQASAVVTATTLLSLVGVISYQDSSITDIVWSAVGPAGAQGVSPVQVTLTPATISLQLAADGSVKAGQLPASFAADARQGGGAISVTSITIDSQHGGSFAVSGSAVVMSALNAGATAADASVTVVAGGQSFSGLPISVTTARDGGDSNVSAKTTNVPTLAQANGSSFAQVGNPASINASASGKLSVSLTGSILPGADGYGFTSKLQYSTNGGSSWADATTATASTLSDSVTIGDGGGPVKEVPARVQGGGPVTITGLGASTACQVRVVIFHTAGTTDASGVVAASLIVYAEQVA